MIQFRNLNPDEVDVRIGSIGKTVSGLLCSCIKTPAAICPSLMRL